MADFERLKVWLATLASRTELGRPVQQQADGRSVSIGMSRSIHIDHLSFTGRAWNRLARLVQAFDVESNGLADEAQGLLARFTRGDASREVGDMSAPPFLAALDDHQVLHCDLTRDPPVSGHFAASPAECPRRAYPTP